MGLCKSPSNGERCKCPVHTRIHFDQEKRHQRHEPWWGSLLFKSCLWPSSDVTWGLQNRKSDAEEEVTLKKSVAHDGRNCQVSVNFNLVLFGMVEDKDRPILLIVIMYGRYQIVFNYWTVVKTCILLRNSNDEIP